MRTGSAPGEGQLSQSGERAVAAAHAADAKLGTDILVLDVGGVLGIAEMFVIASAANTRQSKAVADEIELRLSEFDGSKPLRTEGMSDRQWILLDYGDIVVHVFVEEMREFYELERLWRDVESVAWQTPQMSADQQV